MTLTNAEIAAIRDRYKQCVHESDYADLAEHIPALLDTIAELREVVAMIVVDTANSDIGDDHFVSSELIESARAVLARMEGTP